MRLHWWGKPKKKKRQSIFGGQVRSDKEIRALGKKIDVHEAKEIEKAEAQLEEELGDLES